MFVSLSFFIASYKLEMCKWKKQLKKQKQKHGYITHTWSGQAIKGTVVNAYDTPSMEGHLKFQEQYK